MPGSQRFQSLFKSPVEEKPTPVTINITSLIDSHLVYIGQISGKQYDWMRAGDTVSVLEDDAPELLKKRLGKKQCCGGDYNKIFQIA